MEKQQRDKREMNMNAYRNDITQSAYRTIRDDDLIMQKYSTPEAVLDYLQEKENFKTLEKQLKETMIKTGLCSQTSAQKDFTDILYNRLAKQDTELQKSETRARNSVRRWINGQFKFIRRRSDLIEICFALKLNYELSTELLNKCGYNGWNIRNAEDAAYLYGILNNRPLAAIRNIINTYHHSKTYIYDNASNSETHHSGETTFQMESQIMEHSNWNSDKEFLDTFLIPNKSKFIAYSSTSVFEYHKLKNQLYLCAIEKWLDWESYAFQTKLENENKRKRYFQKYGERLPSDVPASEVRTTYHFINAVKKYAKETDFLSEASDKLSVRLEKTCGNHDIVRNNTLEIFALIRDHITTNRENPHIQAVMSDFLSDVISADRVLFQILPSIVHSIILQDHWISRSLQVSCRHLNFS